MSLKGFPSHATNSDQSFIDSYSFTVQCIPCMRNVISFFFKITNLHLQVLANAFKKSVNLLFPSKFMHISGEKCA